MSLVIQPGLSNQSNFETLCRRQFELESLSITDGKVKFQERVAANREKHQEATSASGITLLKESINPLLQGIQSFLNEANSNKAGRKHVSVSILTELGPEAASVITSKIILDNLSTKVAASSLSIKIGKAILDELRFRKFQKEAPQLFEWRMRTFNTSNYEHMKKSISATAIHAGVDTSEYNLPTSHVLLLGTKLLSLFIEHTQFVSLYRRYSKNHSELNVEATQETMDWVLANNNNLQFMCPEYLPTVIPPKPWTNIKDGGYWFRLAGKFKLLRTDGRHQLQDLDNVHMPVVYDAVNSLQETSWLINERVLKVIDTLKYRDTCTALPSYKPIDLPKRPEGLNPNFTKPELEAWKLEGNNADLLKRWRHDAHQVHEDNHIRRCKVKALTQTVATARLLNDQEDEHGTKIRFYFPYNLDFRGRAYPIPLFLTPQGDDVQKGLLMFGEGKALRNQKAADWLAIHGANTLADTPSGQKLDKLPFEDRIRWIHENTSAICDVAEDPIGNSWWQKADSPFMFLAFCFEWADYQALKGTDGQEGLSFVSSIGVALDGSCNGLQHYSAMLRDPIGGLEVNLVPSSAPCDIYRTVAGKVLQILQEQAACEGELFELVTKERQHATVEIQRRTDKGCAVDWLTWGRVDRKFVKRQVMTLPYGSKTYGFKAQIKEFLRGLDEKDKPAFMTEDADQGFTHCLYMARVVWEALSDTVVASVSCMEYFQKLARLCTNKDNLPIAWVAPSGLVVVQGYRQDTSKRIDTVLAKVRYFPQYYVSSKTLNKDKQVSGIAPNIVHSLDASAMMLTVVAARKGGIDHFACVHDSYGTHAADTEALARITREEFVKMYTENDVLESIETSMLSNLVGQEDFDVSTVPQRLMKGELNLERVKESEYFFA